MRAAHPPAIAGGTDPGPIAFLTFRAKPRETKKDVNLRTFYFLRTITAIPPNL